jgi:hypothetical protein
MNKMMLAWISTILFFTTTAYGQISLPNHFPYKNLVFPQIAAGGEYQTWITVNNRGDNRWSGAFRFYKGEAMPWNPYINNTQISGGILPVTIDAGATRTFIITQPGNTESGFLLAAADSLSLDNFLQGNLTYFVGIGQVNDSIGVMPSNPFFAATIPFEDFNTICFAFANADPRGRAATVKLKLYSDENASIGSTYVLMLENLWHLPRYLRQMFEGVSLQRGRVEIESDVPIFGVALIQSAGGQFSSLPLGPTTRTYIVDAVGLDLNWARFTLWPEGLFVNGYVEVEREGSYDLFSVFGQIREGKMLLHFDGDSRTTSDYGIFGFIVLDGDYRPDLTTISGSYYIAEPSENWIESGSFTAALAQ